MILHFSVVEGRAGLFMTQVAKKVTMMARASASGVVVVFATGTGAEANNYQAAFAFYTWLATVGP